jgi:YHS domain-containing protein
MERFTSSPKFLDPVCGMGVRPGETRLVANYQGHSYWFCSESCRFTFESNPQKYLKPKAVNRKDWLGRYIELLVNTGKG